jgi:methylated-DNA-[protein]-cysteine S-methyltransferase
MTMSEQFRRIDTPLGPMVARCDGRALTELAFDSPTPSSPSVSPEAARLFARLEHALSGYFAGDAVAFDLPLAPLGTPFQRTVWDALLAIPYGATASYLDIAMRLGRPSATRAVGAANGRNPIPILIPCHRVIGANGTLTGYAGGLERKRALLALESKSVFALSAV